MDLEIWLDFCHDLKHEHGVHALTAFSTTMRRGPALNWISRIPIYPALETDFRTQFEALRNQCPRIRRQKNVSKPSSAHHRSAWPKGCLLRRSGEVSVPAAGEMCFCIRKITWRQLCTQWHSPRDRSFVPEDEETDEECAHAPGSPTGRQGSTPLHSPTPQPTFLHAGSDLMAAKAARQRGLNIGGGPLGEYYSPGAVGANGNVAPDVGGQLGDVARLPTDVLNSTNGGRDNAEADLLGGDMPTSPSAVNPYGYGEVAPGGKVQAQRWIRGVSSLTTFMIQQAWKVPSRAWKWCESRSIMSPVSERSSWGFRHLLFDLPFRCI